VSIEFPLSDVDTRFGIIPTPLLTIPVLTKFGYQSYQFLFDTGADFTMLPRYMSEDLGINLKTLPKARTFGIEDKGITVFIGKLEVKFATKELTVKCLFSEKDTTPFLLGRMDIFTNFSINFDNIRKKVIFIPIK